MGVGVRRLLASLGILASVLACPTAARASGMVLGAEPISVRVVIAPAADRTTRWYSLGVGGSAPLVWVIPIGREAAVDDASGAWLEAVDVATAPRVVPACGGAEVQIARLSDVGPTRHASSAIVAKTSTELDSALAGVWPTPEQHAALDATLAAHDLLVVRTTGSITPTVRVVDRDGVATAPLALTTSPRDLDVTVWILGDRRAAIGVDVPAPSQLHWVGQTSDYILARDTALAKGPASGFITETSIASLVDQSHVSPSEVPSLASEYFARAAERFEATGSAYGCTNSAVNASTSLAPFAYARASVAGVPLEPCTRSSAYSCGSLVDDLALGVGGLRPKTAWITRLVGRVPANTASMDLPVRFVGGDPVPLVKVALGGCKLPPPSGTSGTFGSSDNGGSSGGGSSWGSGGGGSCGGSVDTGGGGGDDCSDDTSGSSSGDDCSGDTSSSSADSCDSGGGGGDACSGGGGGDACDSAAPKKTAGSGKSPVSRATLGAAFVLFGLRRWKKRRAH